MTGTTTDQTDGQSKGAGNSGDQQPRSFTQEQVNSLLAEEKRKVTERYSDYDDLKAAKTELDEIKAKNASELDQAVNKARKEGETAASVRANQRLVASEARALAAGAGFHNPRDAAQLLDLSKVKVNDEGEVDSDAVKALIDALATERPYLVKTKDEPRKPKRDPGQGNHGNGKPDGRESGRAEALRRYPQLAKK